MAPCRTNRSTENRNCGRSVSRIPNESNNSKTVSDVKKEIQFYLIDLKKPDPWGYAKYHCGTESNIYSPVHWSFFETETKIKGQRTKARIRQMAMAFAPAIHS